MNIREMYDHPREVKYGCGCTEVKGGNIADPSCTIPEQEGWLDFEQYTGSCDVCTGKLILPKGHYEGDSKTGMGMTWVNDE